MNENGENVASKLDEAKLSETFPIVGIGASAGGLEALEQFFEHTPEQSGMCFVVVQHLSPDFKSLMNELLGRRTRIPIIRVEDGIEIKPNNIYLMPPRKEMVISGGRLFLTEKDPNHGLLPIDHFFRSLANDAGDRSVGVILSGTGSDGSRGIRDIHDKGGLVVAQSEESARFDGMPRSVRETGLADLIVSASDMPDAILELISRPNGLMAEGANRIGVPEVGLKAVFRMLRTEYGIDFSQYKPSTVARRIDRRLLLNQSPDVDQYVQRLAENPGELNQLYKDLLIGVTEFFRDPEAFDRLKTEVLPSLMESISDDREFRCWVACCATGEEAYSIAILINEYATSLGRTHNVRIFATDVHRASLDIASLGIYNEEQITAVSKELRERYFIPKGDMFQVSPLLRKMVVFAPHDVLKDAPFTRLDLVTCRNMLIYLQPDAQKKVLSLFYFGLNTGGVLFLGPSETPGDLKDELEPLDEHWKIYRKSRDIRLRPDFRLIVPPSNHQPRARLATAFGSNAAASDRLQQSIYDRLLETHLPPSFLINDRRELVHSFGGAGKYLRVRDGRISTNLLDLIDADLKTVLLGALPRVERQLATVKFSKIRIAKDDGHIDTVRLTVEPLHDRIAGLTSFLIVLESMEDAGPSNDETVVDMAVASREHVATLEHDLRYTRENLQAMIEEQESSNEELQATNEELVASNEELQSTNEELHSVNEELYTVNAEYQHKIDELTRLTADMDNLLVVTNVGIVFLDTSLRIRRFTAPVARLFNLLPQDVGRTISSFNSTLDVSLMDLFQEVLEKESSVEREVRDLDGNCYFLRILPYRINSTTVDGIVMSIIDISALKTAESRLEYLSSIVESTGEAVVGKDLNGVILSWNHGAEELYGYRADEIIGSSGRLLYDTDAEFEEVLNQIRSEKTVTKEQRRRRHDGSMIEVLHTISPIRDNSGHIIGASGIAHDITERKRVEREIATAIQNRDRFLAMLSHELRNPLGAILNAAHVLDRADLKDETFIEARRIVRRQAQQVRLLLDDLLDVARITQNKIELRCLPCRIADVVAEAIQILTPDVAIRNQRFEISGLDSSFYVFGDPARLQQVVINLLKNAIKYSQTGECIWISLAASEGDVVIQVRDTGAGIAPEILPKVFDLFVQSKETLDRSEGGMGVGLTLVKTIVELHRGSVSVASGGTGQGSEFTVRLPMIAAPENVTPRERIDAHNGAIRTFRIAIIEDNPDSRTMLQSLLSLDGHTVETAGDGLQGHDLVSRFRPDVALIDIGLPRMDGFELATKLRSDRSNENVYLIALTGYGLPADRERARAAGFDAHLVKPLDLKELSKLMSRIGDGPFPAAMVTKTKLESSVGPLH